MWRRLIYLFPVVLILATIGVNIVQSPNALAATTATSYCDSQGFASKTGEDYKACQHGFNGKVAGTSQQASCKNEGGSATNQGDPKYICYVAWSVATVGNKPAPVVQPYKSPSAAAKKACTGSDSPVSGGDAGTINACERGYDGGKSGKTQSQACSVLVGESKTTGNADECGIGWDLATGAPIPGASSRGSGSTGSGSDASAAAPTLGCDTKFTNPLTWIICPVTDVLVQIVGAIDNAITNQLNIKTDAIFCTDTDTCQAYYSAWQSFRNIALGLMAIAGLIIVIAQALGVEVLDAYTIRKTLPRLLIVAVAITLSWPLMKFLIDLSDDLGFGVRHLIYAPFSHLGSGLNLDFGGNAANIFFGGLGFAAVTGAGVGAAAFTLLGGIGALLGYAGTAALAVFVAIVVLILRQIIIILLMLLAPVALVAYILPNTQRIYRLWGDTFLRALLMFPLISALIATGRVFSAVAIHNGGALNQLIGFAAYFAPYFLIPLTFRMSGAAINGVGSFVNSRAQGGFEGLRKFRTTRRQKGRERILSGNLFNKAREGSYRQKLNQAYQSGGLGLANTDRMGSNPMKWRRNAQQLRETANLNNADKLLQSEEFKPYVGDDDFAKAAMNSGGSVDSFKRYLRETGKFSNADIEQKGTGFEIMQRKFGTPALEQGAFQSALTASTFLAPGQSGELLDYIDKLSGGRSQTQAQLIAKAKDLAPKAGRGDVVAPFSDMMGQLKTIGAATTPAARAAAIRNASEFLADTNEDVEGSAYWFTGKGRMTEAGIPAIQRKIKRAASNVAAINQNNGQPITITRLNGKQEVLTEDQAHREMKQVLAQVAGTSDVLQQVSPEKQRLFAEGVLSWQIPGFKSNVIQNIDDFSTDPEFTETRSRYERNMAQSMQRSAQAEQAAAQAGANMTPAQRAASEAAAAQAAADAARQMGGGDPNVGGQL
ncbi:MAG TPA: hypothetical protein VLF79_01380 [Candidatus Saccharimonadales bacterium]|nr:hypothetical protein [Candidatus Saccharimonadales bacterium]